MSRANAGTSLHFGFGALGVKRDGVVIAMSHILGSITAELNPEVILTEGGASSLPIAARYARASGEGSITLRERPTWIERELWGGSESITAPIAQPRADALVNLTGSSVASEITLGVVAVKDYMDIEITATAAAVVDVKVVGSNGAFVFKAVAVSNVPVPLGQTGITIESDQPLTVGDSASGSVRPAHGGASELSVPQVIFGKTYELSAFSARGGASDAVQKWEFPKVHISGANMGMTDIEATGDTELMIRILAPDDGGAHAIRTIIQKQ